MPRHVGRGRSLVLHRCGFGAWIFHPQGRSSAIDCVIWKMVRQRQSFQPRTGDQILVHGQRTFTSATPDCKSRQMSFTPPAPGFQLQLEQLRQRLEAEGLFDHRASDALPAFPAADRGGYFANRFGVARHPACPGRRFPLAALVLSPAVVQGDRRRIVVLALEALAAEDVDVIIVARGGGSAEDLWAFNDEQHCACHFRCSAPVVSAIGHETDMSIADLVADVRASTPSVAAELVSPDVADLSLKSSRTSTRDRAHTPSQRRCRERISTPSMSFRIDSRGFHRWQLGVMQSQVGHGEAPAASNRPRGMHDWAEIWDMTPDHRQRLRR